MNRHYRPWRRIQIPRDRSFPIPTRVVHSPPMPPPAISSAGPPRLPLWFFRRDAVTVARELIGCTLVRRFRAAIYQARIVETEAYVGPHDLACHASKGKTARTRIMFRPGGRAYVYFIYGMYDMLNVVTGHADDPQAVLIRAAEPLSGWPAPSPRLLSGPGKLTRALHITRAQNGRPLTQDAMHFLPVPPGAPPITLRITPRIGVDYAKHWKDAPLRFLDAASPAVSR